MPSLLSQRNELSRPEVQLQRLEELFFNHPEWNTFEDRLRKHQSFPLQPSGIEIFQMNLGKLCNQTCKHCHVDAGPDRTEIMSRKTMEQCLDALEATDIPTVDITGGAPEINADFRWLVQELRKMDRHVMVRCNLTVIMSGLKYRDLPDFFAQNQVEVISSLPFYRADRTDRQRGDGVFQKSIEALQALNEVGYGHPESDLSLNLVYNPAGAFLPANQISLEQEFRKALLQDHGVRFNQLFAITNMPISRFLEYLIRTDNLEEYMEKLLEAFNPAALPGLMCRNTISVSWDGFLYDCDFNQMLEMKLDPSYGNHISSFDLAALNARSIATHQHCFGCTAGAGSSCGGSVV
ncbi:MAG: arsenosugar biosynthesis radical SAM protein ArsS [Leptospiraceae bacterium]|nr:arsenosugar biosynthesis radical SAM protein ArsS [Leptospiraceae bacterium]